MVGWYDPPQLFATGLQVAISSALGTRVDARQLEGLQQHGSTRQVHVFPADEQGGLWFDYAADVGDGFKSTYQIAHTLARSSVRPSNLTQNLPRGRFLVLGGDEVYPTASKKAYQERLLVPYQLAWDNVCGRAWQRGEPARTDAQVFAIPGNHDWYDGLVSFTRLFCQNPALKARFVGDWTARQGGSYFVIELPHRWWLWAVDIQLESDIDEGQLTFFSEQAARLSSGDRVILATAEPAWIYGGAASPKDSNLEFLIRNFITPRGATVHLTLAGDLHHYRHHQATQSPDRHKIIAGGGGAFLHPTHNVNGERGRLACSDGEFEHRRSFPSAEESEALSRGLWWKFPKKNPLFCLCLAGVYTAIAWGFPKSHLGEPVNPWQTLVDHPGFYLAEIGVVSWIFMLGLPLGGYLVAKDQSSSSAAFSWVGLGHGTLHVVLAVTLYFELAAIAVNLFGVAGANSFWPGLARVLLYLGLSTLLSGALVGQYLRTSLKYFSAHPNEAFSAIACEDYKSFLRLHITPAGNLEVFPLGIRQVKEHPCDATIELIEDQPSSGPIRIVADAAQHSAGLSLSQE